MMRDIIVAAVSAIVTGLIGFAGANAIGLFKTKVSDSQLVEVARQIVDDQRSRETLIQRMNDSGKFVGPPGPTGPQGSRGVQGEVGAQWTPKFEKEVVAPTDKPGTIDLGVKSYCAISRTGTHHARQACSCFLQTDGKAWKLRSSWDTSLSGTTCICGARCAS